jgi:hypothetical protein
VGRTLLSDAFEVGVDVEVGFVRLVLCGWFCAVGFEVDLKDWFFEVDFFPWPCEAGCTTHRLA